jgi:hypothetical protein
VGGRAYLAFLTEGIPPNLQIDGYARIIREKANLRNVVSLCNATLKRAWNGEETSSLLHDLQTTAISYQTENPNEPETTSRIRARVVCLADVEAKPVRWLWEPYIPLGMVSMISGDPGAGKSYVALAIAVHLTKESAGVLYMTLENPLAEVMRPRLDFTRRRPQGGFGWSMELFMRMRRGSTTEALSRSQTLTC